MANAVLKDWKSLPEITAYAYSDDHAVRVSVDARPWLAGATPKMLRQMEAIEWGGDQVADDVYHEAQHAGCPQADKLASYLALNPRQMNGDTMGFEVHLDREEALDWLSSHRPDLFVIGPAPSDLMDLLKDEDRAMPNDAEQADYGAMAGDEAFCARFGLEIIRDTANGQPIMWSDGEGDYVSFKVAIEHRMDAMRPAPTPAGGPALTRKMVSQIAKAFEETGKLSYLQRLDVIAKAIGLGNQASMMAVLRAAEEPEAAKTVAAAALPVPGPRPVVITAFGERISGQVSDMQIIPVSHDGDIQERNFETPEEARAYLKGIEDMDGYMAYEVAAVRGTGLYDDNADFFEERDRDPQLTFRDWHNTQVRRLEEEGDAPGF